MSPLSLFSLAGRRALITGSSRGLGFAMAKSLAGAGASVVINARDTEALGRAASDLAATGADVKGVAFDVTSIESIEEAVDYVETDLGPIDILINNAGLQFRAPLHEFPLDKFELMLATHVTGTFAVARTVAQGMIKRQSGKIINICSLLSNHARPSVAPYGAAKAAIANLTRGMATDWARYGLNVNAIAPGYFKTELNAALMADPEFNAWIEKRTPMGRWGEVDELGPAAIFLASDASSFVNGHILYVDGAFTATV